MTNQEIIDLAAEFDLITFGRQDLVFFAREIESRTAAAEREACAKVCESLNEDWDHLYVESCAATIRERGKE